MGRSPRNEVAGGVHHVTARGNRKQDIVRDDVDRRRFVHEFERVSENHGWRVLTWCLMTDHAHLVVETPAANLGQGMGCLLSRYARVFNDRHELSGHLTQGRFHSVLVTRERHFAHLLRYVALNPVTARLVDDPMRWRWSAHPLLLAQMDGPLSAWRRVEELLAVWGGREGRRYRSLLYESPELGPWHEVTTPAPPRPTLEQLTSHAGPEEAMRAARWEHGYRLREIAEHTGWSVSAAHRRTAK
jgi:REP element-mobilizing transposase RayT